MRQPRAGSGNTVGVEAKETEDRRQEKEDKKWKEKSEVVFGARVTRGIGN
jgi:hypothetical protein